MIKPSDIYQSEIESGEITADPAQRSALEYLDRLHQEIVQSRNRNWLQKLQRKDAPKGLYLWGGVGTGKTLLMDIFSRSLSKGIAQRIHFHRFMQSIHQQKNRVQKQQNPLQIIASDFASNYQVLCLDEFSVTDITDAMILYGLLQAFFDEGVILVTTSNIQRIDLYKNGLQRSRFLPAIELLNTHTHEIHVDSGTDYRMAYLQNDSIYHTPLGPQTEAQLAECFSRLAPHHEASTTSIEINGRQIPVVAAGSGVAWFEFSELCMGNRSKLDYIELSRQFHSLILANIPNLDDTTNDPARRLIELVDELYDRGVNLITSAASAPEEIYSGRRLAAPFERTVSRLQEMSSLEYIARPHLP